MPESLIVSFVGDDRPGIVRVIADVVAKHGGSWQESRMSGLGGYFSGTARILINPDCLEALDQDLQGLALIVRAYYRTSRVNLLVIASMCLKWKPR